MIIWNRRAPQTAEHHHDHEVLCTALCCAQSGDKVCVTSLVGCEIAAAKLRDLGVREGVDVTVVRHGNPLLVSVDGARFGIGLSAAENIMGHLVGSPADAAKKPLQLPLQPRAKV